MKMTRSPSAATTAAKGKMLGNQRWKRLRESLPWLALMFPALLVVFLFNYLPMLVIACVAATPLAAKVWRKIPAKVWKPLLPVLVCLALVVATAYLVDGTYNPFLYFRF